MIAQSNALDLKLSPCPTFARFIWQDGQKCLHLQSHAAHPRRTDATEARQLAEADDPVTRFYKPYIHKYHMNNPHLHCNHILVGLGGTGGRILQAFKVRLFEEFPDEGQRGKLPVALLYVDSSDELMPEDGRGDMRFRVHGHDASFANNECLTINTVDLASVLDQIDLYPSIKGLGLFEDMDAVRSAIGHTDRSASLPRLAGRLMFAVHAHSYVNALRNAYHKVAETSGQTRTRIHILAGLGGGTGSGAVVDAIVQTRKAFPEARIHVYGMVPEVGTVSQHPCLAQSYSNAYAALRELNALQTGRWKPQDVTGDGKADCANHTGIGVADDLCICSMADTNGTAWAPSYEVPKLVSDYLFATLFSVSEEDPANLAFIRAYDFESMEHMAYEYDETASPDPATGCLPVARTKKVKAFGIQRVVYPQKRLVSHAAYTVGRSVLLQYLYDNWQEGTGYTEDPRHGDFCKEIIHKDALETWMLDIPHLTLERKILASDEDYEPFSEYWHGKAIHWAKEAERASRPLDELDHVLNEFYKNQFRGMGVERYYESKEKRIPELAREIRCHVENSLFREWNEGRLALIEIQQGVKLIGEQLGEITGLEKASGEEKLSFESIDAERRANVRRYDEMPLILRMMGRTRNLLAMHQDILADYYTSKTRRVALEFARKLTVQVALELERLDEDIACVIQLVKDTIDETKRRTDYMECASQRQTGMGSRITEVYDTEAEARFENDLTTDRFEMGHIARKMHELAFSAESVSFGQLVRATTVNDIMSLFDSELYKMAEMKHEEADFLQMPKPEDGILGQLQRMLHTDDEVHTFAQELLQQSGELVTLDQEQLGLHLRNNEGSLSPSNPASIDRQVILVLLPSHGDNCKLRPFADKLTEAFRNPANAPSRTSVSVNHSNPNKDEITIIRLRYCFPLRCIKQLKTYKEMAERLLHAPDADQGQMHAILLFCHGRDNQMPRLLAEET